MSEVDRHKVAKNHIEDWDEDAAVLYHCGLCNQIFTSFKIFYDHRQASEQPGARKIGDGGFLDYTELGPGAPFPEGATVGQIEPCEYVPALSWECSRCDELQSPSVPKVDWLPAYEQLCQECFDIVL